MNPGVVDLGVGLRGIGELRAGGLFTKSSVPGDGLGVEAAAVGRVLGYVGDAGKQVGLAEENRAFAAFGPGLAKAQLKRGVWGKRPVVTGGELACAGIQGSVVVASYETRKAGRLKVLDGALTVAEKAVLARAHHKVGPGISLVVGRCAGRQVLKVRGGDRGTGDVGHGQQRKGFQGDRVDIRVRERHLAIGIHHAGVGVLHGNRRAAGGAVRCKQAAKLGCRGQRCRCKQVGNRAQAFVVREKEQLILADGSAERAAELVLHQCGLDAGTQKGAKSIQVRVAEIVVSHSMKVVAPAPGGRVDDGTAGAAVFS